jgi:hypothetical protein
MSDKPTAAAAPEAENETKADPTLFVRRVLCWVLSALTGGTLVALTIKFFLKTNLNATVPISFVEVPLLPLAAFPATLLFMIWFDLWLKTRIVND